MKAICCIIVGAKSTGKTSILLREIEHHVPERINGTIGVEHTNYVYQDIRLQCWDTSGDRRFERVIPIFSTRCHIAIYVVDVSRPSTLDYALEWYEIFSSDDDTPQLHVLIINKMDLENKMGPISELRKQYPQFALLTSSARNLDNCVLRDIAILGESMVIVQHVPTPRQGCCW